MAQCNPPDIQPARPESKSFDDFLFKIETETKAEVDNFLSRCIRTDNENPENPLLKQLENALQKRNVIEVWKLIVETKEQAKDAILEGLSDVWRSIAEKENIKEDGCSWECVFRFSCGKLCTLFCSIKSWITLSYIEDDSDQRKGIPSEEEQTWIRVLSNPLYISLEYLWRMNPKSNQQTNPETNKRTRRRGSKSTDVIEAALDDSYLLEKVAAYEHHYNRDEYLGGAKEYEQFAVDIIEQAGASQLSKIIDIEGKGPLLNKAPKDFIQSLSLLKKAADKQRKLVRLSKLFKFIEIQHLKFFDCRFNRFKIAINDKNVTLTESEIYSYGKLAFCCFRFEEPTKQIRFVQIPGNENDLGRRALRNDVKG